MYLFIAIYYIYFCVFAVILGFVCNIMLIMNLKCSVCNMTVADPGWGCTLRFSMPYAPSSIRSCRIYHCMRKLRHVCSTTQNNAIANGIVCFVQSNRHAVIFSYSDEIQSSFCKPITALLTTSQTNDWFVMLSRVL